MVKNLLATVGDKRHRFHPSVEKIPWKRVWQPTPVFLPGESHGQRRLMGHKELDMTEATYQGHTHIHWHGCSQTHHGDLGNVCLQLIKSPYSLQL